MWKNAHNKDAERCLIRDTIISQSRINQANLARMNFNYRSSLRNLQLVLENGMIALHLQEPNKSNSDLFCKLHTVPPLLHTVLFVCFHAKPIGGHLNAYRAHTCLRLRYYWPVMYTYCVRKFYHCLGCVLSSPTTKINELV
jgi:hypothetical protein